ncbi:MAG: hypothetical protein U0Y08_04650 [Bacteroidia bacterium]
MKRILPFLLILFVVACSTSKKTGTTPVTPVAVVPVPVDSASVNKDTTPPPQATLEVKIGLLLPMQIKRHFEEDTVPDTNPLILPEAVPALQFYEGALLAKDSLATQHCYVRYKIIDTGTDSLATITKINTTNLSDMDAVISLLPPAFSKTLAAASERWKKPLYIFNAPNTQILEQHAHLYLVSPSNNSQIRMMASFLAATYPNSNFLHVFREQRKEDDIAKLFASVIDSVSGKPGTAVMFNWKNGWAGLKPKLAKGKRNVLIVPTSDESFLSSLLNKLKEEKEGYTFMLCGLPSWEGFESIDPLTMKEFDATFFNGTFIDYKSAAVQGFRKRFIQEYHTDPLPQAFWGYDLVRMVANDVNKHSRQLSLSNSTPLIEVNRSANWVQVCEGCGYENRNVNFLRFGDFEFVKLK